MYTDLHAKWPLFLSYINKTSILSERFSENIQISSYMEIRPVGAIMFIADGYTHIHRRTDRHDGANSRVSQYRERA